MPRAATTSDAFNAIAEVRRREIIDLLSRCHEYAVGDLVLKLKLPQPTVSKHLGVLRKVGLVSVNRIGKQRLYRLNPRMLQPVYEWVSTFERFWTDHLEQIKQQAERKVRERADSDSSSRPNQGDKKS